jgi:hypothetical protein
VDPDQRDRSRLGFAQYEGEVLATVDQPVEGDGLGVRGESVAEAERNPYARAHSSRLGGDHGAPRV